MAPTRKVARLFPEENPKKPWTNKQSYKKWVRKLTRKRKEPRRTAAEDLCVGAKSICAGDLGIPRKYMPQFNDQAEIKSFTKFVRKAYHIKSRKTTRRANQLRSTQKEISRKRIDGLIKDGILNKVNIPIIISGDNYVVDGHHRWAAYRLKKSDKPMPAILIDAPIKDILGIAVAWGAKHQEF
jgi:hypothetical protein